MDFAEFDVKGRRIEIGEINGDGALLDGEDVDQAILELVDGNREVDSVLQVSCSSLKCFLCLLTEYFEDIGVVHPGRLKDDGGLEW